MYELIFLKIIIFATLYKLSLQITSIRSQAAQKVGVECIGFFLLLLMS